MSLRDTAARLDAQHPLASFRDRFALPPGLIYLDGNSLGPPVRTVVDGFSTGVIEEWRRDLVLGWDRWIDLGLETGDLLAPVIGARRGEVALTDQTSVNLYKVVTAAVRETHPGRIVTHRSNFPSDRYVLDAIASAEGLDVIAVEDPRDSHALIRAIGGSQAVVVLTHVDYRTGAMLDGAAITDLVHEAGGTIVWDLAHSAGAVPVDLEGWGADLAVGCTYKYLNGGPGAPGFVYVRADHQRTLRQPIEAWFGHADQFGFHGQFDPAPSIRRFQTGTPPILSLEAARHGIATTVEAGMEPIRTASVSITDLFIEACDRLLADADTAIATPRLADDRGSHVAVVHEEALPISRALRDRRVIVDYRAPDIVRFGFAPLYNTHAEAIEAAEALREILASASWREHVEPRSGVT